MDRFHRGRLRVFSVAGVFFCAENVHVYWFAYSTPSSHGMQKKRFVETISCTYSFLDWYHVVLFRNLQDLWDSFPDFGWSWPGEHLVHLRLLSLVITVMLACSAHWFKVFVIDQFLSGFEVVFEVYVLPIAFKRKKKERLFITTNETSYVCLLKLSFYRLQHFSLLGNFSSEWIRFVPLGRVISFPVVRRTVFCYSCEWSYSSHYMKWIWKLSDIRWNQLENCLRSFLSDIFPNKRRNKVLIK